MKRRATLGGFWTRESSATARWRPPTTPLQSMHVCQQERRGVSPEMQAGDVRRLLDMYERWHRQVAPAVQYDAFIEDLEKMGQTYLLKARPIPAIGQFTTG